VIPGFGPPLTLSGVPRAVAAGGLHTVAGQRIYVSRGIGMERGSAPPVRLFCRPELTVLTLHPTARAAAAP
jgi:predicted MPP superfamily phosphohydrolase